MLIDWFTVGAQALNFLVLVWLLKRFLYGPILAAIDAREARIRGELDSAAAARADAEHRQRDYEQRVAELEGQRKALLDAATADAEDQRKALVEAARAEADAIARSRRRALAAETARLGDALRRQAGEEVLAISRAVLGELADTDLEGRIVARFLRALDEQDEDARTRLATAMSHETPVIRSALALPADAEEALRAAVADRFEGAAPPRFELDAELVGGIELSAGGLAVSWTISAWLDRLQNAFEARQTTAGHEASPAPGPTPGPETAP
ncbi:MAG TPA: F0F1 ATP synthase subunit B [Pseudomonadales bacterium]|nr:F0F1 ATP synthase subunit B [Pseudomonadales bacterium]